jgi:tetratricopeptide (TPR) repeat protein
MSEGPRSQGPDVARQVAELVTLGRQFLDQGRLAEAENIFVGLRAIVSGDFEVNKQLGIVLATRGAWAAAREPLAEAAAVDDSDPVVFNVLSACAFETGDYADALAAADRALALQPAYPEAHNNRGNALLRLDRPGEAVEALTAALRLMPRDAEAHLNLGNALDALDQVPAALQIVERAIALNPKLVPAHVNRGNILQRLGRHREALQAYDRAIALNPGDLDANWNRALCHLLVGDYEAGWAGHEWRWRLEARKAQAGRFAQPLWLGQESLQGRTILLQSEQGYGDVIQFARYVRMVAERGGRVVFEAFPPLAPLMAGLAGADQVVRRGDPLPPFDLHCPLLSLPLALGEPEPLAMTGPYLRADLARFQAWAERLGAKRGPRVGLVGSGSRTHRKDALRSIPFETLAAKLPAGPEYHLLQKDVRDADRAALAVRPDVAVWDEALGDFADTAALCELMDIVISVDTSVAHLAGALGRPVWVLLPVEPDWRWGLERETTPWYPQMRLYRQTALKDWSDPLDHVARDLRAEL